MGVGIYIFPLLVKVSEVYVIREHAIISKPVTKDIVSLRVALDAIAVLPVESLKAEVVVIVRSPPV